MSPQVTIIITTRNRRDDLRKAIASALAQDVPVDVLVIDDASTDGTPEMVRSEFPQVRLERSEQPLGYIIQRTRAGLIASTPIIISIDDDAFFASPSTVRQTLADFDHPRIGAVAVPYIDVTYGDRVRQRAPDDHGVHVISEYRGTAHALRRDIFNRLGGYRSYFFHQVEEGEYCMRLLNAGYVVRLGRADPIHHVESPNRDMTRMFHYTPRNHILWAWYDVPMPHLLTYLPGITFRTLRWCIRKKHARTAILGALRGYLGIVHELTRRTPVTRQTYRAFCRLHRTNAVLIEKIEPLLPPRIDLADAGRREVQHFAADASLHTLA